MARARCDPRSWQRCAQGYDWPMLSTAGAGLQSRVDEIPFWWHSIDLGGGVVTPGVKTAEELEKELAWLGLGDLRGKSVLDVGSWDGYFAFAAERLGADRVVALDHYVWATEVGEFVKYRDSRVERGLPVAAAETLPEVWHPSELPGKRGFDLAHEVLGSNVEVVVGDLIDCDIEALGDFDVVLYLGVLYHMRNPLLALERLVKVTREVAIIETQAAQFRGLERLPICQLLEGDELNADPTNWWTFNEAALLSLCRAAGFARAEVVRSPPLWQRRALAALKGSAPFRAYVRASK
jgi:tRNA (mo5U34)-methyltransferase